MPRRLSLSCRQFRRLHAEYTDGFVSGEMLRACEGHVDECPACARQDVMIRRSLLALQALPVIEPSAGFHDRLAMRLSRDEIEYMPARPSGVRWGIAGAVLAASVALLVLAPSRSSTLPSSALQSSRDVVEAVEASAPATTSEPLVAQLVAERQPEPARAETEPTVRASRATRSSASTGRFEAIAGQAPLRTAPPLMQSHAVRLQTVNYLGQ